MSSSISATDSGVADAQLLKALADLEARLQECHPSASAAMIQRSIDDAIQAFNAVRIRQYLPIFIERAASKALHDASISHERAAPTLSLTDRLDP